MEGFYRAEQDKSPTRSALGGITINKLFVFGAIVCILALSACLGGSPKAEDNTTTEQNLNQPQETPVATPPAAVVKTVSLKVTKCAGEQGNMLTSLYIQNTGNVEINKTFTIYNADTRTDTGLRVTVMDGGRGLLPGQSDTYYTEDSAGATSPIARSGSYILGASGIPDVAFTC